jgi:hypothetical protein
MPKEAARRTTLKTKKKTKVSVRGRLSISFNPSAVLSHKDKTLHFIGVGRLKDAGGIKECRTLEDRKGKKHNSKRPKLAVCSKCGRIWKKTRDKKSGLIKTCPECKMKRKILSGIRIHIPTQQ